MKSALLIFFSLLALIATACGQPGPLYLPIDEEAAQTSKNSTQKTPKPKTTSDDSDESKIETETDQYYPY